MTKHPIDGLEPASVLSTDLLVDFDYDLGTRIQLSIAISLKRIADELTGNEKRLGVVDSVFEAITRTANR